MEKNKDCTKLRLINAVSRIIEVDGFSKLGINRIARIAECDKVLIYRYFGDINGLLTEWAKENDYYISIYDSLQKRINTVDKSQVQSITKQILLAQIRFLRENRMMQELLIWELSGHKKFKVLQDIRERDGNKLQQVLNELIGHENGGVNQYITVLIAAINFIILYTRQYPMFNGIDFSKEHSWEHFEKVIGNYIDTIFDLI